MDVTIGSAVYSRAGRDKGGLFMVLDVKDGYAYLADGDKRRAANPKKKKLKHLNRTNFVSADIAAACAQGNAEDCMIRKALAELKPI